jgi:hypothetical protein
MCKSDQNGSQAIAGNLRHIDRYPQRRRCRYYLENGGIRLLEGPVVIEDEQGAIFAIKGKQGVSIAIVASSV